MYALNLGEGGRVLSVTWPKYAPSNAPKVETLPEGDTCDYLYVDGEFIYDPLPEEPEPEDPMDALQKKVISLQEQNDTLLECLLEMSEVVYN